MIRKTLSAALIALMGATPLLAAPKEMTFGIVPQQSASRLAQMWTPFLSELSERTGVTFQFRTTKDIPTFEACLAAGAYDFAYMNPMHYALFSSEAGYHAIARQSNKKLKGILVTRKDALVDDLAALDGGKVAFPSPGAFGASILTRSALSSENVSFVPNYVKSHDSVYRAVAAGLMDAGGGVLRTFGAVDPAIRDQLTVVYETEGYTPHAIAAQERIGAPFRQSVQAMLLDIAVQQPDIVKGLGMKGFEAGHDTDWDDVRALQMTRAETGIAKDGDVACPSD